MRQLTPCLPNSPKMLGTVKAFVLSSRWPWLVPAQAKARLGMVIVGAEQYQWSHTAKPRARPLSTGSVVGVWQAMIMSSVVPGTTYQPLALLSLIAAA